MKRAIPAAVLLAGLGAMVAAVPLRSADNASPSAQGAAEKQAAAGDRRAADQQAARDGKELPESSAESDLLEANAGCYVCHTTFVKEELAKVHLQQKIGCVDCHGPSAKHANDENVGATKPDIVIPRGQIDPSCLKCHETHDASAKKVIARLLDRKLAPQPAPTCTDCHGTHNIEKAAGALEVDAC